MLRPFAFSDAARVKELVGDVRIYATTLNIPHPYEEGMAEKWMSRHSLQFFEGKGVALAIATREESEVVGCIGLTATPAHRRAELGYWLGVDYWNLGYTTEAARALVAYGFEVLCYHKITSRHFKTNPASGRVMQKLGMRLEGTFVDDSLKDGEWVSSVVYGLLRRDWEAEQVREPTSA